MAQVPRYERQIQYQSPGIDDSRAMAHRELAQSFAQIGNQLGQMAAQSSAAIGEEEGRIAGGKGKPEKRSDITVRGRAFNQAAMQSYRAGLEADMRQTLAKLADENRGDSEAFSVKSDEYLSSIVKDIDPTVEQDVRNDFALRAQAYRQNIVDGERKRAQLQMAGQLEQDTKDLTDSIYRSARDGVADIVAADRVKLADRIKANTISDENPEGVVTPEFAAKILADVDDNVASEYTFGNFLRTLQDDGIEAAKSSLATFAKAKVSEIGINPDRRDALVNKMEAEIRGAESVAVAKKSAAEQTDKAIAKDLIEAEMSGYDLSPEQIRERDRVLAMYEGEPWAEAMQAATKYVGEAKVMTVTPIQQQRNAVIAAKADVVKAPPDLTGEATARAEFLEQRYQQNLKALKDDPWSYYEKAAKTAVPTISIDESLPQQLLDRRQEAYQVKALTGVNPGLLKPAEAEQVAKVIQAAPPDIAIDLLDKIGKADPETAAATFDSIGKIVPAYSVAGKLQATGATLPDGRKAGGVMLTGHKAMESKAFKFKNEADINRVINDEIGDMFANAPNEFATARDAVKWLAAGKLVVAGKYEVDSEEEVRSAITAIINPVEYSNGKVSAPVGTDPDDFEDVIAPRIESAIRAGALSEENKKLLLDRHKLLDADGDGVYDLAWQSGVRVLGLDGYPIKVRYK